MYVIAVRALGCLHQDLMRYQAKCGTRNSNHVTENFPGAIATPNTALVTPSSSQTTEFHGRVWWPSCFTGRILLDAPFIIKGHLDRFLSNSQGSPHDENRGHLFCPGIMDLPNGQ